MKRKNGKGRSLFWLFFGFVVTVLLNAMLFTACSYMLIIKTDTLRPLRERPFWPMLPVLLAFIVTIAMMFFFGRRRVEPIRKVIAAMRSVSKGDFSVSVEPGKARGEVRELVDSCNHMTEELRGIEMFRSDFINNFSHEFKTPIVSIRGFAKQLERDDLTDEERREYAGIIFNESERLVNMSSNVLLLTKLENTQVVTDKKDCRLDEQIRSCLLLLQKQWEDKSLEPRLDLDEITFSCNEELLSHIWLNLLGNAIKYSPEGGVLGVSLMRVQNFIVARVSDEGEGMDEVTQARIFEKFYQGDSAHAARGNGLGLPLVKRITELCGGRVTVQSAPGQGSTFSVYLPVEEERK